jgi:spore coat protein U-like protein
MRRLLLWTVVLLAFAAPQALGQTCTLSLSALSFGTYTGPQLNGTATGKVTCAGAWDIPFNQGTGVGATQTIRKMTGTGGATLNYQLFTDAARTINWSNTTGNEASGTGNATVTIYGQIAAAQYATPGTYTDTISSATTTMPVSTTVQANCTVSAAPLTFGTYSGTQLSATSTISTTCTNTTAYNVGLSAGTATGATVTTRKMTGPSSSVLSYKLSSDSGNTINWGNTIGTNTVSRTGTGAVQSLTVYGQVSAGQYVAPGSYSDTITVTLTY